MWNHKDILTCITQGGVLSTNNSRPINSDCDFYLNSK